jgi:hypothetical protein
VEKGNIYIYKEHSGITDQKRNKFNSLPINSAMQTFLLGAMSKKY